MSDCQLDLERMVTLRHRELVDEAAWRRLASAHRRRWVRAAAARWLRAAADWLDGAPGAAARPALVDARR